MSDPTVIDVEPVGEASTDLAVYRPGMVMSADESRALSTDLQGRVMAVLRPEVDFGVIPGTGKPSLLKPGAERLLQWFGLGFEVTRGELERDEAGKPTGVYVRCVVTKSLPDRQVNVGSAEAYASRDEKKWAKAPFDTILAMAEKRAVVRATLRATATSGYFTSDMEDHAPAVSFGSIVQGHINALGSVQKDALKEWWKGRGLPRVVDLSGDQAAEVLVQIGKLASGEEVANEPSAEDDGAGGASATPPDPAAPSPSSKTDYDRRRAAANAALVEVGIRDTEVRHQAVREATGGATESTAQLTEDQMHQVRAYCQRIKAERAGPEQP